MIKISLKGGIKNDISTVKTEGSISAYDSKINISDRDRTAGICAILICP